MKKVNENAMLASVEVGNTTTTAKTAEIITSLENQLAQGIEDYFEFVPSWAMNDGEVYPDDFQPIFFEKLARKNLEAKKPLADIFEKSKFWDPILRCLVIDAERTQNPDPQEIANKAYEILNPAFYTLNSEEASHFFGAAAFFGFPDDEGKKDCLKFFLPKVRFEKKKSRIFAELCKRLGVWKDDGEFQMIFSNFCNEMNAKKISEKIYFSLNPIHFLTGSNPQHDTRNATNTSCHSLTQDQTIDYYATKTGTIGYALDDVSIIAFTVSNADDPTTLNNRKTTRQLFHYKDGVLLQSRLYMTFGSKGSSYGGLYGYSDKEKEICKMLRELLQKEICNGEEVPNFWGKPTPYEDSELEFPAGNGFSGYPDWIHFQKLAIVSIRKDSEETAKGFEIGGYPICINCGEYHEGLTLDMRCEHCSGHCHRCEDCGEVVDEEELTEVINQYGERILICQDCLDSYYFFCEECEEYHHESEMEHVEGYEHDVMCHHCAETNDNVIICDHCGSYLWLDSAHELYGDSGLFVCEDCFDNYYDYCAECDELVHARDLRTVYTENGDEISVCCDCLNYEYTECPNCGKYYHNNVIKENGGICPDCAEEYEEDDDEEEQKNNADDDEIAAQN